MATVHLCHFELGARVPVSRRSIADLQGSAIASAFFDDGAVRHRFRAGMPGS
jgi:hypothetical protein